MQSIYLLTVNYLFIYIYLFAYFYKTNFVDLADSPWTKSDKSSRCGFIVRWPITTVLWLTIPDCRKYPRLRMLTFVMCIFWIGMTSYVVAFLITIVGKVRIITIDARVAREYDSNII